MVRFDWPDGRRDELPIEQTGDECRWRPGFDCVGVVDRPAGRLPQEELRDHVAGVDDRALVVERTHFWEDPLILGFVGPEDN